MIANLTLYMNKVRQARDHAEIIEVRSGAEALCRPLDAVPGDAERFDWQVGVNRVRAWFSNAHRRPEPLEVTDGLSKQSRKDRPDHRTGARRRVRAGRLPAIYNALRIVTRQSGRPARSTSSPRSSSTRREPRARRRDEADRRSAARHERPWTSASRSPCRSGPRRSAAC